MDYLAIRKYSREFGFIKNPHFWLIILLTVTIAFIYYWNLWFPSLSQDLFWSITVFEFKNSMHGILFCISLIYAALIFWWRGSVLIWLVSLAIILPKILYFSYNTFSIIVNIVYLLIPLIVILYISVQRHWRLREKQVIEEREKERQGYLSQIFKAQESERQRLARELHDSALQTLLVIATRAQAINNHEQVKSALEVREMADWIQKTSQSLSQELRRLTMDLRPSVLDDLGLSAALRWLVTELEKEGIDASLKFKGERRELSPEMDINIFRIVQEALNNVRFHAKATRVSVEMVFLMGIIRLVIQDNGQGFSFSGNGELIAAGKLGLIGMQQRAKFLGGNFIIESGKGEGTRIVIEFKG